MMPLPKRFLKDNYNGNDEESKQIYFNVGDTVRARLSQKQQFLFPTDQIRVISSALIDDFTHLKEDIDGNHMNDPTPINPSEIKAGCEYIVRHRGNYWRAVALSFMRVDMIKCVLIDVNFDPSVLIPTSLLFPLKKSWKVLPPRVMTFRFDGLAAFSSSPTLLQILQYQIDWETDFEVKIVRTGEIPSVICRSKTYSHKSINEVILSYLYMSFDPGALIAKHQTWPNTEVTSLNSEGEICVQLDTPLQRHLEDLLQIRTEMDPLEEVSIQDLHPGSICLAEFPSCPETYKRVSVCHSGSGLEIQYIDTGFKEFVTTTYPVRLFKTLPNQRDILKIPSLCVKAKLSKVEWVDVEDEQVQLRTPYILERIGFEDKGNTSTPVVELFSFSSSDHFFSVNDEILIRSGLKREELQTHFRSRTFSSLWNWSIPFFGSNWGKGTERIFDLVQGTRIYGQVTRVDTAQPGFFNIRPLQRVERPSFLKSEPKCGCLMDGDTFLHCEDGKTRRCRLLNRSLPDSLPHFTKKMLSIRVPVSFLDEGTVSVVPTLSLAKLTEHQAVIPIESALVHWAFKDEGGMNFIWTEETWARFRAFATGKTFKMELRRRPKIIEPIGKLVLSVRLFADEEVDRLIDPTKEFLLG